MFFRVSSKASRIKLNRFFIMLTRWQINSIIFLGKFFVLEVAFENENIEEEFMIKFTEFMSFLGRQVLD